MQTASIIINCLLILITMIVMYMFIKIGTTKNAYVQTLWTTGLTIVTSALCLALFFVTYN